MAEKIENHIVQFMHCKDCLRELPDGVSPREFVNVEVGFTSHGIQIWCIRHEKNVVHLDFLGQKVASIGNTPAPRQDNKPKGKERWS